MSINLKIDKFATLQPQKFEKTFRYDNTDILDLTIENFEVSLFNKNAEKNINRVLFFQTQKFLNYVDEMFKNAIFDYKNSNENHLFNPYEAFINYVATYNDNCVLSTYYDKYTFTGGAHGSTLRSGTTFSLKNGNILPLSYWFKGEYKKRILNEVTRQADELNAEQPGLLFDNYQQLIKDNFNSESYYLTAEGLAIYYGQYDIGPYSSGIMTFIIPFDHLDVRPSC